MIDAFSIGRHWVLSWWCLVAGPRGRGPRLGISTVLKCTPTTYQPGTLRIVMWRCQRWRCSAGASPASVRTWDRRTEARHTAPILCTPARQATARNPERAVLVTLSGSPVRADLHTTTGVAHDGGWFLFPTLSHLLVVFGGFWLLGLVAMVSVSLACTRPRLERGVTPAHHICRQPVALQLPSFHCP